MSGTVERSLKLARSRGWIADKVERWQPFMGKRKDGKPRQGGVRKDAFGFIDLIVVVPLAGGRGKVLLVQATSRGGSSAHKRKIESIAAAQAIAQIESASVGSSVGVELWSWEKPETSRCYELRRERLLVVPRESEGSPYLRWNRIEG